MADRTASTLDEEAEAETAEAAFRRIAGKKLISRGFPDDQIEVKITELLQTGVPGFRINVDAILNRK